MENIGIILRRPPYGSVDASKAIRHALGGVTNDMNVKLLLVDKGVHSAQKGQAISSTEHQSIEEGIKDCIDMGVEVYVDRVSLRDEGLEPQELIEGVNVIGGSEMAEILSSTDVTMIF